MTGTDTLRKLKAKIDNFYYDIVGEFKIAKWRRYFPSIYFNKNLNNLTFNFYDCSYTAKPYLSKKHLFDLHFNNYAKIKWLSLAGITIWFPYTFDEIKQKFTECVLHDELKEFEDINNAVKKEMADLKREAKELVYYADTAAKILREQGFPGKAEALESRMLKLAKRLGMETTKKRRKPSVKKEVSEK